MHTVVGGVRDYDGPGELLQREGLGARQRRRQHRLEEHDARRVLADTRVTYDALDTGCVWVWVWVWVCRYLVVLDELGDGGRGEHGGVVRVEAEAVLVVLDARVQRAPVLAERHREQVLLLRRVAQQERACEEGIQTSIHSCHEISRREQRSKSWTI